MGRRRLLLPLFLKQSVHFFITKKNNKKVHNFPLFFLLYIHLQQKRKSKAKVAHNPNEALPQVLSVALAQVLSNQPSMNLKQYAFLFLSFSLLPRSRAVNLV